MVDSYSYRGEAGLPKHTFLSHCAAGPGLAGCRRAQSGRALRPGGDLRGGQHHHGLAGKVLMKAPYVVLCATPAHQLEIFSVA